MDSTTKPPRECEIATVDCYCDRCNVDLSKRPKIWVWREFTACSKGCIMAIKRQEDERQEDLDAL